jgi:tetratricopeptide (TPR) repeat protein
VRRAPAGAAILLLAGAASLPAQVIDVRAARPAAGNTFEALWAAYLKADRGGDAENAKRVFQEIRRLRIERNIESLEVIALGLVAQGHGRLAKGERDKAEELFRSAVGLDPYLPDAYFGLGRTQFKRGPLGILPGVRDTLNGVVARLPTVRGQYYLQILVVVLGLVAVFATTFAVALALVVRHGTLLLHDLEEGLGWGRSHSVALAFYVMLVLLPVATFQGYAWLPLWWLALLFIYFNPTEKAVAVLVLLASLGVGPLVKVLERSVLEARNPLFWASVLAVEGGPDARATAQLEAATKRYPDDRDLVYLLAAEQKAAGRYEDAAELYQGILRVDPNDGIAKNNLALLVLWSGVYSCDIA